ncbi:tetratricopeptide repeat protein [Candidatus Eisenbacteria bacterium]|uniref:Tetratricopeptide repeat protein n=1 Tax=Eiseniibacteriota bacterium TaxID=2212470 RepID=A0ABV6YIA4_UNCEI
MSRLNGGPARKIICVSIVLTLTVFAQAMASQSAGVAESAYELRMKGKLDDARKMLEEALVKDPDYAAGHYELARLTLHMGLGNPREMSSLLPKAQESIDLAMEKDPTEVAYPFFAGHVRFMLAYMAMQQGGPDVAAKVASSCSAFEAALRLKPDYREAKLHLVELYADAPEGGDRSKAEAYTSELEKEDEVFGVKARSILEDVGVADWKLLRDKYPGDTDVIEELGKAYLNKGNVIETGKCFEEAIRIDPKTAFLFMDLGRYHVFGAIQAMQSDDKEVLQMHLSAAEIAIRRYLEFEQSAPMKAYALEMLAKVKRGAGDQEEKERLRKEAQALDPHHSKATGSPGLVLFMSPGTILQDHRYLARPY